MKFVSDYSGIILGTSVVTSVVQREMKLEPYARSSQNSYSWSLQNVGRCSVLISKPTNLAWPETKLSRKNKFAFNGSFLLPSTTYPVSIPDNLDSPNALGLPYSRNILWSRVF